MQIARFIQRVFPIAACMLVCACGGGSDSGTPAAIADSASRAVAQSVANAATPGTSAPPAPLIVPSTGNVFYGVNGHNGYGPVYRASSLLQQRAQLQDLGFKIYRNEVFNRWTAQNMANVARTMAAGGITAYPLILLGLNFPDEQTAYDAAYALARQIVSVQRYAYYEVGNEMAERCLAGWVDGTRPGQFDNACYQRARGVLRGLIAGVRSVDTAGKIIIGGSTWLHFGFFRMLASGTQPDGTGGHPLVAWDITAWHWYSEQGDITHACGGTGCYNVAAVLQSFGKPIWLTEVSVRPNFPGTQEQAGAFLADSMLGKLSAIASQYGIESLQIYQLYDDPPGGEGPYGLLKNDGRTPKPAYADVKNFIAAHPR